MSNSVKALLIFLHSILLLVGSYFIQSNIFSYGDEKLIADILEKVEHNLLHINDKVDTSRFVFLNTSKSKMLIPAFDNETGFMPIGNESISDREQLIQLLRMLEGSDFEYLILDIFFDSETDYDSTLEKELFKFKNHRIPYHLDDDNIPIMPVINGNLGLADIRTIGDVLYKYRLIDNGYKSLPLVMYEDLYSEEYKMGLFLNRIGNQSMINDFVMNFRIRNYQIFEESRKWNYLELGELLAADQTFIKNKVKDRIIIVGDFENDTTESITGTISGPLVLLNAFLSIENGEAFISVIFIIYLFIAFIFLTIIAFDPYDFLDKKFKDPKSLIAKALKSKSLRIVLFISLISITAYLIFGMFISIFFLALYVIIIDKSTSLISKWRKNSVQP